MKFQRQCNGSPTLGYMALKFLVDGGEVEKGLKWTFRDKNKKKKNFEDGNKIASLPFGCASELFSVIRLQFCDDDDGTCQSN